MLHPKGADKAPAQQDGQQSWRAAVDSCGARCTIIFVHFSKTPHFQRHKPTSNQAK